MQGPWTRRSGAVGTSVAPTTFDGRFPPIATAVGVAGLSIAAMTALVRAALADPADALTTLLLAGAFGLLALSLRREERFAAVTTGVVAAIDVGRVVNGGSAWFGSPWISLVVAVVVLVALWQTSPPHDGDDALGGHPHRPDDTVDDDLR